MAPSCGFYTCNGPEDVDEVDPKTPDEVERCSCDESLALRRELGQARALIDAMERGGNDLELRLATTREAYRAWRTAALRGAASSPFLDPRRLAVTSASEAYSGLD